MKVEIKKYAAEMVLPAAMGKPAQVRKGFASAREADIWLTQVQRKVADNYNCTPDMLAIKGFVFRVYRQQGR